jgi:hypothetical protein
MDFKVAKRYILGFALSTFGMHAGSALAFGEDDQVLADFGKGVIYSCEGEQCNIFIPDIQLTPAVASDFDSALDTIRADYGKIFVFVNVDSPGGSVEAAMKIGSKLRLDPNHAVVVGKGARCLSSCVFILSGATQRQIWGSVGVHRPYYPEVESISVHQRNSRYKSLVTEARNYFEKMNIRPELADDMFAVSPENMKYLTNAEQAHYGINRVDPVLGEMHDDMTAKNHGLSKVEYLRRKALYNRLCTWNDNTCIEAILNQ